MAIYRSININRKQQQYFIFPFLPHILMILQEEHRWLLTCSAESTTKLMIYVSVINWQDNVSSAGTHTLTWVKGKSGHRGGREMDYAPPGLVSPLLHPVLCFQRSLLTSKYHKNHQWTSLPPDVWLRNIRRSEDRSRVRWDVYSLYPFSPYLYHPSKISAPSRNPDCLFFSRFQ